MTGEFDIGIDPMTQCDDNIGLNSVVNGDRRVAWVFEKNLSRYMINKATKGGFKFLPIYPTLTSKDAKVRIKGLTEGGWSKITNLEKLVGGEMMLYNPKFPKQAKAARKELRRRDGYWHQTKPKSDIHMARLMGYGEKYIIPFVKKEFPSFNIDEYIEKNPRNLFLETINK